MNTTELACSVLLPVEEVDIWMKHLETVAENSKKGAEKAATRRAKQQHEEQSSNMKSKATVDAQRK